MRNQNIELLRTISAFGIVVFHAGAPGAEIGYAGLIAFTMLTTMFEADSPHVRSVGSLAQRLLLPWTFWSVIYIAVRWIASGRPFHDGMNPIQSLFYGGHLWFLPFAFVAITLVGCLKRSRVQLAPLAAAVAAVLLLLAEPLRNVTNTAPIAQWLHIGPAVFLGVAATSIAPAGVVMFVVIYTFTRQISDVSIPYMLGFLSVIIAKYSPRICINVEPISRCMFGVYLVHPLALSVANRIVGKGNWTTVTLAFLGSLVFVSVARRFARPIVG